MAGPAEAQKMQKRRRRRVNKKIEPDTTGVGDAEVKKMGVGGSVGRAERRKMEQRTELKTYVHSN